MTELTKKYRPQLFEEVLGQKDTVRYLSELIIRGVPARPGDPDRRGRNVLLYGSIGSGKTTLARIYARALNCQNIDRNTGSPCSLLNVSDLCTYCKQWKDEPLWFTELSAPRFQSSMEALNTLESHQNSSLPGVWNVLFIDEAHSLARFRQTIDNLLKPIEDAPLGVIYILATSELDELPNALKSRFPLLPVRPLSITDARDLQRNILDLEKEENYESSALDLIAGLSLYQARDILNNLEKVLPLPVSVDNVRRVFGGSDVDQLTNYFEALAIGNSKYAIDRFLNWPEANVIKVGMIKSFLLVVFFRNLSGVDVIVDPLVNSIESLITNKIVSCFKARIEDAGLDLKDFWLRMVDFWRDPRQEQADGVTLLQLVRFQQLACNLQSPATTTAQHSALPVAKKKNVPITNDDLLGSKYASRRRDRVPLRPDYLDYEQVRDILNTSSISIQAYGLQFNTKITLFHRGFGISDSRIAAENMSKFVKAANEWLKIRGHTVIPRITVQENDPEQGYLARNIFSITPDCHDDFRQWCLTWSKGQAAAEVPAIEVQVPDVLGRADKRRDRSIHKDCVSWLIAGMNPDEKDRVERLGSGGDKPLHELVDLRATLRVAGSLRSGEKRQRRHASSNVLDPSVLAKQVRHKMFFLSAFNDGAWDELWGNWQLEEYDDRRSQMKERDKAWNDAAPENRNQLEASWPNDPRERRRSWKGWWT